MVSNPNITEGQQIDERSISIVMSVHTLVRKSRKTYLNWFIAGKMQLLPAKSNTTKTFVWSTSIVGWGEIGFKDIQEQKPNTGMYIWIKIN